jgi:tRNA nucleotidyltransferase (CCA-adding enzyme)
VEIEVFNVLKEVV